MRHGTDHDSLDWQMELGAGEIPHAEVRNEHASGHSEPGANRDRWWRSKDQSTFTLLAEILVLERGDEERDGVRSVMRTIFRQCWLREAEV